MSYNNCRLKRIALVVPTICLLATVASASVKLPSTVSTSLENLHPNAKVLTANVDEDGLYLVDLDVNQNRFLVELTRSGRVVSNNGQGKVQIAPKSAPALPTSVTVAIKQLYPQGKVASAKQDDDGIFHIHVDTPQGVSNVEATRSGRILKHDRDASDQDEDFSTSNSAANQHIESVRKLPASVLTAAEKAHPQSVIVHVYQDHYGPRYGRSEYYVTMVKGNQVKSVGVSATGKILKNSIDNQSQRLESLPMEIRNAARTAFPTGVIYGAGTRNNIYQIDVLADGVPYDLEITKAGQVISNKRDYHE